MHALCICLPSMTTSLPCDRSVAPSVSVVSFGWMGADAAYLFSPRYLVKDRSRPGGNKAMAGCVSRLREALNLLPQTDSRSLGESISATLSAGRSVLQKQSPLSRGGRIGEQQDLRQQQVLAADCTSRAIGIRESVSTDVGASRSNTAFLFFILDSTE